MEEDDRDYTSEVTDDDDSSEEEEEEEEEEEDVEEEPRLKYTRITQLPPNMFTSDSISTCLISDTFFAFATHGGFVHITNPDLSPIRTLKAHTASVLALSTDGNYLASASLDGTVVVGSVQDAKDITKASFGRPVHAVAIDPNYKSSRAFVSGGSDCKLILSERGWLGRRTDIVLAEYEDAAIVSAHWIAGLIIWMSEHGITIYSRTGGSVIYQIPKPDAQRVDMYKPRVCSPESNRIYIAWVDTIWSIRVELEKPRMSKLVSSASSVVSMAPEPKVEVDVVRKVDYMVGGIAPFHHNLLMLGCFNRNEEDKSVVPPPELKLYDVDTGDETLADELQLKHFQEYGVNDYHLGWHQRSNRYFIVSAKDAVIAMERDMNDRLQWLTEHDQYEQAWAMSGELLGVHERKDLGVKWVNQLIALDNSNNNWQAAVEALNQVLIPLDPIEFEREWERWGWIFIKAGQCDKLAKFLPTTTTTTLQGQPGEIDRSIYDACLIHFLETDRTQLLHYLKEWSTEIYNTTVMKEQIEDQLADEDDAKLRKALVELYVGSGDPVSAVNHLVHLHDLSAIDLVRQYHLLPTLKDSLFKIMTVGLSQHELDHAPVQIIRNRTVKSINLVVEGRHQVLPQQVIDQCLPEAKVVAFLYLEQLNEIDQFLCKTFGDLQVKLYAEFDRPKLLGFMKKNSNYNLGQAVTICEESNYIPELVYLLGKVGKNKRALKLIIEKLQDPEQAIQFANEQNDTELWEDLIDYSMDKPQFIKMLLERGGSAVDPVTIIKRLSENMEIPQLKDVLNKIFMENELVLSINQGVLDIVKGESQQYSTSIRDARTRGSLVNFDDHPTLDINQTLVVTPSNEIKGEKELVGDDLVWANQPVRPGSVSTKIRHLGYILKYM